MPLDDLKERTKAIDIAVGQIEKQFGKGSIMRLGQRGAIAPIEAISTGAISIDYALGIGGFPRGRVTEIYGPESSGKTTLALQVIAEAQKGGGMAAFVDAEHALDAQYAQKLGVDLENLLVSQPDNGEQALEIVEVLIRSNSVDVVVVDSVAALVPKAEIEGEMGEAQMGLQARLMSQALRKLTGVVSKSKTTLIFINQLREKIGVMFGNPETTTGGRALKFYASVRIDIRRIASIKDGDQVIGGRTRVKVVKNKVAPPFREAEFDMMYGEGISREGDLLDLAVEKRIVEKSGAWFAFGGERLGQGRENAKQFLKDNPDVRQTIEDRVRKELGLVREAEVAAIDARLRTPGYGLRARSQRRSRSQGPARSPKSGAWSPTASDRASVSGRRRTPSPVASTTCPPCPIFDITRRARRDVSVSRGRVLLLVATHTVERPAQAQTLTSVAVPGTLPQTTTRGRTDRGLYGPHCGGVNPDRDNLRAGKRGRNECCAGLVRDPGGNELRRSTCATLATDLHDLPAALATRWIAGYLRHFFGIGREPERRSCGRARHRSSV